MTSLLLIRLSCPHAPACASALIVALGGVTDWTDLLLMAAAVILVTAQSVGINRLASLPVPIWSSGYDDTKCSPCRDGLRRGPAGLDATTRA